MLLEAGDTAKEAGAVTVSARVLVTVKPPPVAFNVTVDEPIVAAAEAVSVSVEEPLSALRVTGFLLHVAVTPVGSPLIARVTAPL